MLTSTALRMPDFLIIGAMKAGSTTTYEDLRTQPQIYFSIHKEPHHLCHEWVLSDAGRAEYAELFRKASPEQLCGEASTGYAKLPVYQGVPERALKLIGPQLRVIYNVREPVSRTMSHHQHLYLAGEAPADFEEAYRSIPDIIDFSRYAMQIEPWIDTFGRNNVHIVRLESHAADRRQGTVELCKFLGIEPHPDLVHADKIFRKATDKMRVPPWLSRPLQSITWSDWYKYKVRPMIPDSMIARLKRIILSTPPESLPKPRLAIVDEIIDAVRDDAERLRQIMGSEKPLWDFDAVRRKYGAVNEAAAGV